MIERLTNPIGLIRMDRLAAALIGSGFLAVAVVSGAVIATENIVLMALLGGAVLSVVLLSAPSIAVWIVLIGTLLVSGPLIFHFPALDRIRWLFSVLGIFLLVAALLHGGLVRLRDRGPIPAFVLVGAAFVLYVLASMLWAQGGLNESGPGARRTLHYWGVFFALALIGFSNRTVLRWTGFLLVLGLIQWPFAIYQRLVVHPSLQHTGAFDSIAGTFEVSWDGFGGSTGSLAFLMCVLIGALFAAYREKLIGLPALAVGFVAMMIPMGVGETNVMFVWLPLAIAAVYIDHIRRRPIVFLFGAVGFAAALAAFGTVYLLTQQAHEGAPIPLEQRLRGLYEYNLGSRGYANASDLNRASAIPYWFEHNGAANPLQATFGHGIGSSYGDLSSSTALRVRHSHRSIDLLAVSGFLWELGIVGTSLFLATLVLAIQSSLRSIRKAGSAVDRAIGRALFSGNLVLLSLVFYHNTFITTASQQVLGVTILGLTAWLDRRLSGRDAAPARTAVPASPIPSRAAA